ncbi:MAG TPA: hypothetical protein VES91_05060, partial [Burkholderiaceae bacterium]|nr:hypothetical protein [Burkholderiaceae bacterium]
VCTANTAKLPVSQARLLAFGNYRGPLASSNDKAQRFFDQGLVFGWGFNFAEAVRSFRAAAQLDLDCALCRWGVAWALGPSINHDMDPADVPVALDAIVQARSNASPGSRDRALIDALAQRYSDRPGVDADRLARAYASAMQNLADRRAADADIAVLAAEAMMTAHAYDYWHTGGAPRPWTPQIVAWLDRALRLAPAHPGAHHYRIHLFEDSRQPERALGSAGELGALAPIVGHLVHMPSHIFFRLGRYRDAVRANSAAVQADREYAAAAGASSDYAVHNLHFLWASALWSGDSDTASLAADQLAAATAASPVDTAHDGTRQHFLAAPALTKVRLGRWDTPAAQARRAGEPDAGPYLRGLTSFANGMTYAARGDMAAARVELESLQRSSRATQAASLTVKNINRASDVLAVARSLLESAIATARGVNSDAVRHARAAVAAEDRLATDDPPVWLVPARHALGAALLRAGRAVEARAVYRADLGRYPQNCAALAGLAVAERRLKVPRVPLKPFAQTSAHVPHCPE